LGEVAAIVLAAGKSTRMKSEWPKVLHEICGRPMLSFVLNACRLAGVDRLVVVVGHGKEKVKEAFCDEHDLAWVEQNEQLGTGHAVQCCEKELNGFTGSLLVIAGDMPLVRREALVGLIEAREATNDSLSMATTVLSDASGYGRIVRDAAGNIERIVEHRDCTEEQRKIHEVNPSYYCFDAEKAFSALRELKPAGPNGEFYLTGLVEVFRRKKESVSAPVKLPPEDAMGINSRFDLSVVGRAMQDRIQQALVEDGATIVDPDNTWVDADCTVGADTTIFPFTFIGAGAAIGSRCRIGPFAWVAPGVSVEDDAVVGPMNRAPVQTIGAGK